MRYQIYHNFQYTQIMSNTTTLNKPVSPTELEAALSATSILSLLGSMTKDEIVNLISKTILIVKSNTNGHNYPLNFPFSLTKEQLIPHLGVVSPPGSGFTLNNIPCNMLVSTRSGTFNTISSRDIYLVCNETTKEFYKFFSKALILKTRGDQDLIEKITSMVGKIDVIEIETVQQPKYYGRLDIISMFVGKPLTLKNAVILNNLISEYDKSII